MAYLGTAALLQKKHGRAQLFIASSTYFCMVQGGQQQIASHSGNGQIGLDGILKALKGARSREEKLMALGQLCSFAESSPSAARLIAEKFSQVSQYFQGHKEAAPYALPALLKISMDSGKSAPLDLFFKLAPSQPMPSGAGGVTAGLYLFLANHYDENSRA